ncbi:MAG: CehA/McbA family metallohydrolase [Chitinophagaceae bacterium]|nr:CehA/McbA family metallohydrolase [Chitinophagaceae bacterium]
MKRIKFILILPLILFSLLISAQHHDHASHGNKKLINTEPQPLISHALRVSEALKFAGSALADRDQKRLKQLQQQKPSPQVVEEVQSILDPYCIAVVEINPEARVKVDKGVAETKLVQGGWTIFLVKVVNDAGVTSQLKATSPNAVLPIHPTSNSSKVLPKDVIQPGESANRFLDLAMYTGRPLNPNLTGQKLEYAVLQVYSKDAGTREAELSFNVGQGTEDIGFRNATHFLFDIKPAVKVKLNVLDDDGKPAMASFTITDSVFRGKGRFSNVYPLPSRRVAAFDEYPDFFFQKQVYRKDGEYISLAPGSYTVTYTRGPEYIPQTKKILVPEGKDSVSLSFKLKRWIDLSDFGWYSADHHVHAAGCSHYDSPEEGVLSRDMFRQALGEDLDVSAVLTWGPSWYYQKQFFTGKDDSMSTRNNIIRYDVEVSGFPSSHAGHIVLLRLREDDYPGTTTIEQWPSWTLPILKWAKNQGGVVGYAHSGWGLEPMEPTDELPNYVLPKMDGIGANEYVVTVTQNAIDFYSAGDTYLNPELNMYYHSLNCGFRTRLSGETDFPCISDFRVGLARSYFKSGKAVNYNDYVAAIKSGASYVTEGRAHLLKFAVNGNEVGTNDSELELQGKQTLNIDADVAAFLPPVTDSNSLVPESNRVFWSILNARIEKTQNVNVELVVNGRPVDTVQIAADGKVKKLNFKYDADRSCWVAVRILGALHSNPIFVTVDGKKIAEPKSAEWCMRAVDQCWKMKEPNIRAEDKTEAKAAYDKARKFYEDLVNEGAK